MQPQKLEFSQIVDEFLYLARSHIILAISTIAAIAVGFVLLDLASQQAANSLGGLVVGIFVQYAFLERILADRIVSGGQGGGRRYGALFVTGFFGNLGIIIGFLLLVVP